jgi:hypothetical protein
VLAGRAAQTIGVDEARLRTEGVAGSPAAPAAAESTRAAGPEEIIVELLAAHPDVAEEVRRAGVVAEFEQPEWRAAAERLLSESSDDAAVRLRDLPRAVRDRAARRLLDDTAAEERAHILADCVAAIERRRIRRVRGGLLAELRAAEARGDAATATRVERLLHESLAERSRT